MGGHAGEVSVCQFFAEDKFAFTASTDNTIRLWKIGRKDVTSSTRVEGYAVRGASIMSAGTKTKAVVASFGHLHFYNVKNSSGRVQFKKKNECKLQLGSEALLLQYNDAQTWIACVGQANQDPSFKILNTRGSVLHEEQIREFGICHASMSACCRWVAICAGMSSVNMWHIKSKDGVFLEATKILPLNNPKVVTACTFSPCCTKAITCCKDGYCRIFHIDVRWRDREDPRMEAEINVGKVPDYAVMSSKWVAVCSGTEMMFYNRQTLELVDTVPNVQHTVEGRVTSMEVSMDEKTLLVSGTDKHAYLYQFPN